MKVDYMKEALRLATASARTGDGPFGAVVVKNGRIMGRGSNAVVRCLDPSAHAEIMAIREACRQLSSFHLEGCEIYTSCEPCPMCLGAIYWSRMARVYFAATSGRAAAAGFADVFLYRELAKPIAERELPLVRMLEEEGEAPFREWAGNPLRVPY
jgi:guanine deaminase